MADTDQKFEYTGGFGIGPCGSEPCGSAFNDENVGPGRPDVSAAKVDYQDQALILPDNE